MSEAEDLLALYGAIDIAVQGDPTGESRARVAALLPLYESPEVHWYSDFLDWRRDEGVELPASVGETSKSARLALQSLAETEPGSNRLAARRLLGLYAVTQADRDVFGPGGGLGDEVHGALAAVVRQRLEVSETGETRADEAARLLHEFIAADHPTSDQEGADVRWSELVSKVRLYVSVSGLEQRPCTGRLEPRWNGKGVVAILESVFDVHDVDFERAITFLVPDKWPCCMDFWCQMEQMPPDDVNRYDEVVSTNCERPDLASFTMRAYLDFTFERLQNKAITGYSLAPVTQPPGGPLVDEGWLIVERRTGFLRVTTTKAVQFNRAFSGEQLALIGCALGWTEKGKDMMYNCARLPENDFRRARRRDPARVSRGSGFPVATTTGSSRPSTARSWTSPSRPSTPGRNRSRRRAAPPSSVIPDIARQTTSAIEDCLDDQVAYLEDWADRVADEDYGYRDMLDDMARASVRMMVDSARILDLATRNARIGSAAARARRTGEPAHATAPDDQESADYG